MSVGGRKAWFGLRPPREPTVDYLPENHVTTDTDRGVDGMTAKELIQHLQGEENAEVLIHDASTDNDLPIGRVEMKYGQPIVLHVENDGSEL